MVSDTPFSISEYANALRRRLPIFLYVAGPVMLLAAALAIGLPNVYRSSVRMEINLEGPKIASADPVELTTFSDQYARMLERNVLSRENMLKWVRDLNVYPDMIADGATDADLVSEMQSNIRLNIVTTDVLDIRSGRELELIEGFSIGFDHGEPEIAQRVTAQLAEALLEADKAVGAAKMDPVLAFLEAQMAVREEEIADLESLIADFKESNSGRLPDSMNLNMSLLDRAERELEGTRREIRELEQNRIFRKAQLDEMIGAAASTSELARLEQEYVELLATVGPEHPDLIRVKRQIDALTSGESGASAGAELTRLEAELAVLLESYTEEHPDVLRKKREIEALRKDQTSRLSRLRTGPEGDPRYLELKAQINAIDTQLRGLGSRESELRQKVTELEANIATAPQVEREYLALQRDLDSARETFRDLQKEYQEKKLGRGIEEELGARLRQMNEAWLPDAPASPPRMVILILGAFLAVSLGGMTAIAAEAIDSTIRGSRDIFALIHTQPIGIIPVVQNSIARAARRRRMMISLGAILILSAVILSYSGLLRLSSLI